MVNAVNDCSQRRDIVNINYIFSEGTYLSHKHSAMSSLTFGLTTRLTTIHLILVVTGY